MAGKAVRARTQTMMLSTPRLHLWSLERHDLMKNYGWANQRNLIRLTGMPPFPKTAAELERWFDTLAGRSDLRIFAIKTKEGEYMGNVELRDIEPTAGRAEMGIFLAAPEARGHGYGREALRGVIDFAFRDLRMHRLSARILEHNAPARKAFESCGFQAEGVEREAHWDRGQFWNICCYGLLASEWNAEPVID